MQPSHTPSRPRSLHRFDARSLVLFASLTMGGTQAIMAQSIYPVPAQRAAAPSQTHQVPPAPIAPTAQRPTPPALSDATARKAARR